ncbi:MAG: helix-turn-helix transcriptional regulator [Coriobacteriia bacterium]|nr:helix-turn-helix transcriptional regulator [Coriobacteriia bacterium]
MDEKQRHIVAYAVKMNRIERGLSIEELAEMAGLAAVELEAIEAEEFALTGVHVNAIADALGVANWVLMV